MSVVVTGKEQGNFIEGIDSYLTILEDGTQPLTSPRAVERRKSCRRTVDINHKLASRGVNREKYEEVLYKLKQTMEEKDELEGELEEMANKED